ncbi:MAG: bifunctional glutamate N-acetyltransferase/amino-acid acetyltransferase ArgJ [Chloroflexi bacterium]|nr:bifunctional glutamate N-acetyltransferase/amino-acid acetyltransferase ArgJ [Chloroflexota bacterium]
MEGKIETLKGGTVTSPQGFYAGSTYAGIKEKADKSHDLGILFSESPCAAAALFTTNCIKAAPVLLSRKRLENGRTQAVVANSGCANACTGEQGLADAAEMADLAANGLGVSGDDVLVASTGVIGVTLPMKAIRAGIKNIALSRDGGHNLAKAIMTTDTVAKEVAVTVKLGENSFTIGGIAKGSGMIHPNLATMLCFLTTDAAVETAFLRLALRTASDISLNMVSVDGDTSTNDTVLLMANGLTGNEPIKRGTSQAHVFQLALNTVCVHLAKAIARDGEGATRLIEVTVGGAHSVEEARLAARTVASSSLVKTAVHGCDPNWGRVLAAVGRSRVEVVESKIDLYFEDICMMRSGSPQPFDKAKAAGLLGKDEVKITVQLNLGPASATAWGCDLSEEYVKINAEYTT